MLSKTKHILIKYHLVREQVIERNIKLEYVGTKEKIAEIFIEPLPREAFEYLLQKLGILPIFHYTLSLIYSSRKGEWRCVQVRRMVVCQGELPFSIDDKRGGKAVRRGFMITGRVLMLPSMPKGGIVDQWLSLMSTQAAPGATPMIYGMPPISSRFESYLSLKLVTPVSG